MDSAAAAPLIGHCYTKARKFPLVVGKLPGGGRLPGGPYSLHQIGVMIGSVVVLQQSAALWAKFGWFNIVIFAGIPYGLALGLKHARIDGRNPLVAGLGWLTYLTAPRHGRLRGRPYRPARPRALAGRFLAGPGHTEPEQRPPTDRREATRRRVDAYPGRPPAEPAVGPTALGQLLRPAHHRASVNTVDEPQPR